MSQKKFDTEQNKSIKNTAIHLLLADRVAVRFLLRENRHTLLASLSLNILSLALPLAILQLYDRIIPNQSTGTLLMLALGVGAALIAESILTLARSALTAWTGAKYEHVLSCSATEHLLNSDMRAFEKTGAGSHLENLQSIGSLKDFFSGQVAVVLADLPFVLIFVGMIIYLAGWLALIPVGLFSLVLLAALIQRRLLRKTLEDSALAQERRYNFILELLSGLSAIKAQGLEDIMMRRYERLSETNCMYDYQSSLLSVRASTVSAAFSTSAMILVAAGGSVGVMNGSISIGTLAACSLLTNRGLQPLQRAMGMWVQLQRSHIYREKAGHTFELPVAYAHQTTQENEEIPAPSGQLSVENLSFRFGEKEPWIVQEVNLQVHAGEAIGIRGEAGEGKTTLLALMYGLLTPSTGKVFVDGVCPEQFSPIDLRGRIAFLPQRAVVFEGTILENITLFRDKEHKEFALQLAKRVGLDAVVSRFAKGYQTRIGPGSSMVLPNGVVQRIAVARALVDRPKILLFDAANTALDGTGDAMVRDLMIELKGHVTLIMVSLRPSLLRVADRTFELKGGRLHPFTLPPLPNAPAAAAAAPAKSTTP